MRKSKWVEFKSDRYRIQDLGRRAVFLVPSQKMRTMCGVTLVENLLHAFIKKYVGAWTYTLSPLAGVWTNELGEIFYDECREYKVAFLGKGRIPALLEVLAAVAKEIDEECIYVEAGQYSATVYPTDGTRSLKELVFQT